MTTRGTTSPGTAPAAPAAPDAAAPQASPPTGGPRRTAWFLLAALAVILLLAGIASGFASGSPDGLEAVADRHGFAASAEDSPLADSPVADYAVAGVDSERLAGGLAGVLGVLLTLAVTLAVTRLLRLRRLRGPGRGGAARG